MKKTNRQIFEELDESQFFNSFERAAQHFRSIRFFPDALGFDEVSGGFLVLHRKHNDQALAQEIPVCMVLKKLGFRICLQEESAFVKSADAQINDWVFEIKRVSKTSRIEQAVVFQFRTTYRKSDRILLHVDQEASPESLRSVIFLATKKYASIRWVWLVFGRRLWQLERKTILKGEFRLN